MINKKLVTNLTLNKDALWILSSKEFGYSDGAYSELYLEKVFRQVQDLSSTSEELERWIIDWSSEYHLTRKRSQLLSGFEFDKKSEVLEVGCGCGAITRFLGENFSDVIAIEGSSSRAKLARLRTKDMDNVAIICAPFQEVEFKVKFDIIFCIGVFEYSNSFICNVDPYDTVLATFKKFLKPDGMLVIAIENQFGLKYFSSCREDHTNRMFEGIEGYPYYGNQVRTFGKNELHSILSQHFDKISLYHPYPDYKLTSCVISEIFLNCAKLGELVGNYKSVDYSGEGKKYFNEKLAYLELDRNNMLSFFSNSFLFFAGNLDKLRNGELYGYIYSTNRCKRFQTITEFKDNHNGIIQSYKKLINPKLTQNDSQLKFLPTVDVWQDRLSLQVTILQKINLKKKNKELFKSCKIWVEHLKKDAIEENGKYFLDGKYLDCVWKNSFVSNGKCKFIDQEWLWHENISLNVLIIRSIHCFLSDLYQMEAVPHYLSGTSEKQVIMRVARYMDIYLTKQDFLDFIDLQVNFYHIVTGEKRKLVKMKIYLLLFNRPIYKTVQKFLHVIDSVLKLKFRLKRFVMNYILN